MAAAVETSIDAGAVAALAQLSEISGIASSAFTRKKSTPTATHSVLARGTFWLNNTESKTHGE